MVVFVRYTVDTFEVSGCTGVSLMSASALTAHRILGTAFLVVVITLALVTTPYMEVVVNWTEIHPYIYLVLAMLDHCPQFITYTNSGLELLGVFGVGSDE